MTTQTEASKSEANHGEHGNVSITIDGEPYKLRRGMHSVSELKQLGKVVPGYALDQVVGGKIQPLPDDGKVHIRGDEVFISHPKDSSSS